jgi:hypothetical protein
MAVCHRRAIDAHTRGCYAPLTLFAFRASSDTMFGGRGVGTTGATFKIYFFLRSAQGEDRRAVSRFYNDVERELQTLEGARVGGLLNGWPPPPAGGASFGDPTTGVPAMVALCSDMFFADRQCRRDWDVFTGRVASAGSSSEEGGEGFIPLLWRPPEQAFPPAVVEHLERAVNDFDDVLHSRGGIQKLLGEGHFREYYRIVRRVAERIAAAQHRKPTSVPTPTGRGRRDLGLPADPASPDAVSRRPGTPAHETMAGVPIHGVRSSAPQDVDVSDLSSGGSSRPVLPTGGSTADVPALTGAAEGTVTPRPAIESAPVEVLVGLPPAPSRIVISFVGADQEWADWLTRAARIAGHVVECVRWRPTHGERLEVMVKEVARKNPDLVVVLFSRRYRAPDLRGPDALSPENWELLGDGGPFGGTLLRVVVDNEPLPEPLRAGTSFDVSELEPQAVDLLFTAAGITPAPAAPIRLPGAPPEIWNSPAENEFFAGRDLELERVHRLLSTRGQAVVVAKDRLPGLGTTEVAIEYAHRYKLGYDAVWWISCPEDVAPQLEILRNRFGASEPERAAAGNGAGAAPTGRLVVFAGVTEPEELADVLPDIHARVLLVAADVDETWADRAVEIGPLNRAESVLLLREAAPMVDPDTAADIVAALGDRPGLVVNTARYLLRGDVAPRVCADLLTMAANALAGVAAPVRPPEPPETARGTGTEGASLHLPDLPDLPDPADLPDAAHPDGRLPTAPPSPAGDAAARDAPEGGAATHGEARPVAEPASAASALSAPPAVARAWGSEPMPGGVGSVTDRDVNSLLGELIRVDCVNDPDQFDSWMSALTRILGRSVDVPPTSVLAAKLLAVVEEAVAQPGPGMLDAVARALEAVDSKNAEPADRQVTRFRHLVDQVGQRWGPVSPSRAAGVQLSVDLPQRPPAARLDDPLRYRFFTSYARHRDNRYVRRLHDALQEELGHRLPRDDTAAGFLDLLSLEGGAHWRHELREVVRTTPTMLALWSDDYFRSDWCGREFAVFAARVSIATPVDGVPPAAILPLNWLPVEGRIPDCARSLQLTNLQLGGVFDQMPLFDLMRQHPKVFRKYVTDLAKRIISVTRDPLPPLDAASAVTLEPAFGGRR